MANLVKNKLVVTGKGVSKFSDKFKGTTIDWTLVQIDKKIGELMKKVSLYPQYSDEWNKYNNVMEFVMKNRTCECFTIYSELPLEEFILDCEKLMAKGGFDTSKYPLGTQKNVFTLNSLIPVPYEVQEAGYDKAGNQWCLRNWGTKWDFNSGARETIIDDETYLYECYTANHTFKKWVKQVSEKFSDLIFELSYYEEDQKDAGNYVYQNGDCLEEITYEPFNDGDFESYNDFVKEKFDYDIEEE